MVGIVSCDIVVIVIEFKFFESMDFVESWYVCDIDVISDFFNI